MSNLKRKIVSFKINPFKETKIKVPAHSNLLTIKIDMMGELVAFFEVLFDNENSISVEEVYNFLVFKTDDTLPNDVELEYQKTVFYFHSFIHIYTKN